MSLRTKQVFVDCGQTRQSLRTHKFVCSIKREARSRELLIKHKTSATRMLCIIFKYYKVYNKQILSLQTLRSSDKKNGGV